MSLCARLFQLFLERWRQEFSYTKSFDGNIDCCHTSRLGSRGTQCRNAFLNRDVVRILAEKVGLQQKKV